jgi:hypothetical protein
VEWLKVYALSSSPGAAKKKKKTPKKQKKTFTLEEKKEVHAEVGKKLEKGQCPPWG